VTFLWLSDSLLALSLLCVVAMASSDDVFRSEDSHMSSGSEAPLHPPSASMDGVSMAIEFGSSRPQFGHPPSSISRSYDGYQARWTAGYHTSSTLAVPGLAPSAAFCQKPCHSGSGCINLRKFETLQHLQFGVGSQRLFKSLFHRQLIVVTEQRR
jgi:hypothetical protein